MDWTCKQHWWCYIHLGYVGFGKNEIQLWGKRISYYLMLKTISKSINTPPHLLEIHLLRQNLKFEDSNLSIAISLIILLFTYCKIAPKALDGLNTTSDL